MCVVGKVACVEEEALSQSFSYSASCVVLLMVVLVFFSLSRDLAEE